MKPCPTRYLTVALAVLVLPDLVVLPAPAASWIANAPLEVARREHTATVLTNGTVLIAGGNPDASAELFDPAAGTVVPAGTMNVARYGHTATLLADGNVLVAGGWGFDNQLLTNAELYNPVTGLWTVTGSLHDPRGGHTMTLLGDGKVLVTGGFYLVGGALATTEVYDPVSGVWLVANPLSFSRYGHTATRLSDGRVLVAGGLRGSLPPPHAEVPVAELFDSATGTWSQAGTMRVPRTHHQATLLRDGRVLIAAGADYTGLHPLADAELYDPASQTWTAVGPLKTARRFHQETLLPSGKVLAVAGRDTNNNVLASAEVYSPGGGTWTDAGSLTAARDDHTATLLPNGNLLVAGGMDNNNLLLASTEIYTSSNVTVSAVQLTHPTARTGAGFQFAFTNTPDIGFITFVTTNLSASFSGWTEIMGLVEVSPGQYQFTDPQATDTGQRFYRVRWP